MTVKMLEKKKKMKVSVRFANFPSYIDINPFFRFLMRLWIATYLTTSVCITLDTWKKWK